MEKSLEQTNHSNNSHSAGSRARLRQYREAYGISAQEAADRLRLNVQIILYFENQALITREMPMAYLRGYLRAYCKLLNIALLETEAIIAELNLIDQVSVTKVVQPIVGKFNFIPTIITGLSKICSPSWIIAILLLLSISGWLIWCHPLSTKMMPNYLLTVPQPNKEHNKEIAPDNPVVVSHLSVPNADNNRFTMLSHPPSPAETLAVAKLSKSDAVVRPQNNTTNDTLHDVEE